MLSRNWNKCLGQDLKVGIPDADLKCDRHVRSECDVQRFGIIGRKQLEYPCVGFQSQKDATLQKKILVLKILSEWLATRCHKIPNSNKKEEEECVGVQTMGDL